MKRGSSSLYESRECPRQRLRLLIHAVDGCVPYLTPSTLEQYFPPSDDLWIGLAVRDTSVLPVYAVKNKKGGSYDIPTEGNSKAHHRVNTSDKRNETRANHQSKKSKESPKPCGYSFGSVTPDRWLAKYTLVAVPSFSLVNDEMECKQHRQDQKVSGSNSRVRVWTPHGKQTLTLEEYFVASCAIGSNFSVSLYDMSSDNNDKRQKKAVLRTQQWLSGFLRLRKDATDKHLPAVWAPIVMPPSDTPAEHGHLSLDHVTEIGTNELSGVALVGTFRMEYDEQLKSLRAPEVALLSADSLSEVLDACCSASINVIGTNLPTRWAKEKKAFAVDFGRGTTTKRSRTHGVHWGEHQTSSVLDWNGCIDIHDSRIQRDAKPLIEGCECLACEKYTRAYLHHLVCANELLAEILLFAHNLHRFLQLLRCFSNEANPGSLKEFIQAQIS